MTVAVLARHLSISIATVETWTSEGLLPPPIKPKGVRLWSWKAVEAHLDGRGASDVQSADPFVVGAQNAAAQRKRTDRVA
jgi:hypothetical protein